MASGAIIRGIKVMKKKLNFWTLNIFMMVVTSFLFNGGVLAGHTGATSLSKGRMGTFKLSGKNFAIPVKGNISSVSHHFSKPLERNNWIGVQQKEEK
jgi:hypothetical protein